MSRQAPYGTDDQPSWAVKIVGSKPFQVRARNNGGRYECLSRTPYKYSSRPPWYLDDDLAEQLKSSKPNLKAISSLSRNESPRTVSKHPDSINTEESSVEERNPVHNEPLESEATDFMLSRLLAHYSSTNFKELYIDMAEYDPRLSGYISEHQVETCFKRHKLPIPSTVMKMILPQFSSNDNVDMINYESLIKYLFAKKAKAKVSHVRKPSEELELGLGHDSRLSYLESPRNDQAYVSPRSLVKKAMDDREEAYLLVQIEQAFKTSGSNILSVIENLHNNLRKLSNGTENIRGTQIEPVCARLGLPLHHTLLEKIVDRFDVKKNDHINWLDFIQFLEKGVPLSFQQSSSLSSRETTGGNPIPFWEKQTPLGPLKSTPRKTVLEKEHPGFNDNLSSDSNNLGLYKYQGRKQWDKPNKMDKSRRSYEILKVDKFRNNQSGGITSPKSSHCDMVESNNLFDVKPESSEVNESENNTATMESKLEKFSHLTDALLRADKDSNGTLNFEEVFRIVSECNLVHNLYLPGEKVNGVIESCTLANTNEVVIDNVAKKLWYLMK